MSDLKINYVKTVYYDDKQSFLLSVKENLKKGQLIITNNGEYVSKVIDVKVNKDRTVIFLYTDSNEKIKMNI